MTSEYHIDCSELEHFDEYEGEWAERECPGQSCAIYASIPTSEDIEEEYGNLELWEQLYWQDLLALGLPAGTSIWIEVDY